MGIPEKRRTIAAMRDRWVLDERRLQKLFGGPVTTEDLTDGGEILRNLGTAIAYANGWLVSHPEMMTAWFLILTLCSSPTSCAETIAPGAPFHDEVECLTEGYAQARRLMWRDGFVRVEIRCEEWPLER